MKRPSVEASLRPLKPFQRRTVEHAFHQLFAAKDGTGRFLVADEVGLGKTLVARGIIARAIDHLWNDVERIDIVYICSNGSIARTNLPKLQIGGRVARHLVPALSVVAGGSPARARPGHLRPAPRARRRVRQGARARSRHPRRVPALQEPARHAGDGARRRGRSRPGALPGRGARRQARAHASALRDALQALHRRRGNRARGALRGFPGHYQVPARGGRSARRGAPGAVCRASGRRYGAQRPEIRTRWNAWSGRSVGSKTPCGA